MKLVFLDTATLGKDISLESFKTFGDVTEYETTQKEQTLDRVKDADIVITNKVVIDKTIMDNSSIKLICVAATGMNNIDLEYAKVKNIEVKNAVGYSTPSVAQLTFGFILSFMQKVEYFDNFVKNKGWENSKIFTHLDVPYYELQNKTIGIIGLGEIGKKVASIAKSFGCNIIYYSTSGANNNANYNRVELDELLKSSDIISIHAPLNDTTNNMINEKNLHLLKDGAILLNLGRGGIVNENDIAKEVDRRELFFATDVVSKEPIEKSSPLNFVQNKERIIITPHIAWASVESRKRLVECIYGNIEKFVI